MIIDLHGMTEQEAIGVIMTALMSFEEGYEDELEIITGNGHVLTRVVEDYLDEEGFEYSIKNHGSYIVYNR